MIRLRPSISVLLFLAASSLCLAEIIDSSTQRHGMHACPLGQYVVGMHVGDNKLLCDTRATSYTAAQEFVDLGTVGSGMHACPAGNAMTGMHAGSNKVLCAPLAQAERFVDADTQRKGMHACPLTTTAAGLHVDKNLLLCAEAAGAPAPQGRERVDVETPRNGMHSCPIGWFVVGHHEEKNLLLCSNAFGEYSTGNETISRGGEHSHPLATRSHGMHACPEGMGITGIHVGNNWLACAPIQKPPIPRFVDRATVRSGMHACPLGFPASGVHTDQNLLLCGTQHRLNILSFSATPSSVKRGKPVNLSWGVECTAPDCGVTLVGGSLAAHQVSLTGSEVHKPDVDTTYVLTAQSGGAVLSDRRLVAIEAGHSSVTVQNCHGKPIHVWSIDLTTGGAWIDRGTVQPQGSGGSCPAVGSPLVVALEDGHQYEFREVAPDLNGCNGENNPTNGACLKAWQTGVVGDSGGPTLLVLVWS